MPTRKAQTKSSKKLINNVTIGADIEVFLQDKNTSQIVTAEGIIKGSKHEPFKFLDENPYFATSLDNIMAEFCIPPAREADEFHSYIAKAMKYISDTIPKDLKPLAIPSALIHEKYLQTENAKTFGCDPDYNAWIFATQNPRPESLTTLRSCGGHIHLGYDKPNASVSMSLIQAMDIFLGLPSILQEPENQRKSLYGKAGCFRFKSYGVEYRTISNYYVSSPELTKWVFNNTLSAVEFVNAKNTISEEEGRAIQAAINHNDTPLAETLCTYFGVKKAA